MGKKKRTRKQHSIEEKAAILRQHLVDMVPGEPAHPFELAGLLLPPGPVSRPPRRAVRTLVPRCEVLRSVDVDRVLARR